MFRKVSIRIFFCWAGLSFCIGCAQQGSPAGGPRDETPPRVVESEPPNYSTRFTANKILITFDEFIVLENVNQELIVSPPMEEQPEVKLRKKTLVIEFEEALKENTTYTFNFGNAITDLHEGNPLVNFEYVFATGDILDSMSVRGIIRYAGDLSYPEDPVSIMLYRNLADSVPLTEIPLYVGRSEDSGVFSINNLSPDTYKVFALKDGNNNLLFDLPTEEIAFLDTSLTVSAELSRSLLAAAGLLDTLVVSDSLIVEADSLIVEADSLTAEADSLAAEADSLRDAGPDLNAIYIDLYMFTEESEIQYIVDHTREDRRRIELSFARSLTDAFRYNFLTPGPEHPVEKIAHFSPERDSLTLWMTDSMDFKLDTLIMQVQYLAKDTSGLEILKSDTLSLTYREPRRTRQRGDREAAPSERLTISTLRNNGILELNRDLAITLDLPLQEFHDSLIRFFRLEDSLEIPIPFGTFIDTSSLYRGWIRSDWQSDNRYRLILYPGAVSSIYPVQHDTLDIQFSTRDVEYYGQILLNLEGVKGPCIVQLMIDDQLISQVTTASSGRIVFPFLAPKEYRIKVIHDENKNGKWDTGDYLESRQPEPVEFLKGSVTVRSKWDHDVTMRLER
jgi:hypothetical protein